MPIARHLRPLYPPDWPKISWRIRQGRAEGRCECEGECGRYHTARCPARHGERHPVTGSIVVLAACHVDHRPDHSAESNLRAWCQRCHLSHDGALHRANARLRLRSRKAVRDLFQERV